jgi:hypothetical protein
VWTLDAFAAFFAVFNAVPAVLELVTLLYVLRVSAFPY